MKSAHKIILVVVALAVLAGSILLMLIMTPPEAVQFTEFEEFDEMLFYIDASGNASGYLMAQMPPSEFSNLWKSLVVQIGIDDMEQIYVETVRSILARYGLEVRDPSCNITGLGAEDNFTITVTWETPSIAQWENNHWIIKFNWVDNQSAAEEVISEQESSWMFVRSVAEMYNIQVALYKSSYRNVLVLPEGAENVSSSLLNSSETIDYGGGSHGESLLHLDQIDGRPAIVENGINVIATENEMTITPQQLLENSMIFTVNYSGVSPENASFTSSVDRVRLDLKYGRDLGENYSIYSDGSWYSLSPAQVLYYVADAIMVIDQGGQFSIQPPIKEFSLPDDENGDWEASWENLSKSEYVSLAQTVRDYMESNDEAPGSVQANIGEIRFRDVLLTFTRVLSSYAENGELPDELTFAPVPTGELASGDNQISANHAYFLLPETYVLTDTSKVNEVLENVYEPGYDNRKFAEELCIWTANNITYQLIFSPPTSDEVLENKHGQCRDFTNAYLALTRTAGIPARRMSGWIVSSWQPPAGWEFIVGTMPDGKTVASHAWTQVFFPDDGWVPAEPQMGLGFLPYEVYKQFEQSWMDALAAYETGYGIL